MRKFKEFISWLIKDNKNEIDFSDCYSIYDVEHKMRKHKM